MTLLLFLDIQYPCLIVSTLPATALYHMNAHPLPARNGPVSPAQQPSAGLPIVSPGGKPLTTSPVAEREASSSLHSLLHWLHLRKNTKRDVKSRPGVAHCHCIQMSILEQMTERCVIIYCFKNQFFTVKEIALYYCYEGDFTDMCIPKRAFLH